MSISDHWAFIRSRISVDNGHGRCRVPIHAAAVELDERLSAVEDAVMALEKRIAALERVLAPVMNPSITYRVVPPGTAFEDALSAQQQADDLQAICDALADQERSDG